MTDIVAFLRARLDEDESAANELGGIRWHRSVDVGDHANYAVVTPRRVEFVSPVDEVVARCGGECDGGEELATHIARHDPARVLAEVEAKRRIVELHQAVPAKYCTDLTHCGVCGDQGCCGHDEYYPCGTLVALALPYSDHPDYDGEWKL